MRAPIFQAGLDEVQKKAALLMAMRTMGALLPEGMQIRFFRKADDPHTLVETIYPDGQVVTCRFTQLSQ